MMLLKVSSKEKNTYGIMEKGKDIFLSSKIRMKKE